MIIAITLRYIFVLSYKALTLWINVIAFISYRSEHIGAVIFVDLTRRIFQFYFAEQAFNNVDTCTFKQEYQKYYFKYFK